MQQRVARRPVQLNLTRIDRMNHAAGGIGLLAWGLARGGLFGLGAAGLGACLLRDAYTGSSPVMRALGIRVQPRADEERTVDTIVVEEAITIGRPGGELYRSWRDLQVLPRVAPRLRSITVIDSRRSRWQVEGPGGAPVEWESEITRDDPDAEIGWRATRAGAVQHFGSVRFLGAGDRGTIVNVRLEYVSPAGALGAALARASGQSPERLVREALRRFKALIETGEIPRTAGQPAGAGRSPLARQLERSQESGAATAGAAS